MTSDVNITSALKASQTTSAASTQLASDFTSFLTLLTTQLQNQDPLSPMDSTEFTSQLVAFAGVEQQINMSNKLDSLVSLGVGDSFSAALNYVGLDINYLSSDMNYDGSTPVTINYSVDGTATETKIHIYDQSGDLIFTHQVTSDDGTAKEFVWDGTLSNGKTADAGTYTVRVSALDSEGNGLDSSTVVSGHVKGLETQNGATYLLVGDRAVSLGNVINVNESKTVVSSTTSDESTSS
ncbi:MAG: flagellar hook capping family protein [Alphaproteobacteria bacterium]|nr:flagellar hook capping family protein [Alphaproteobacteria bacterium]